MNILGKNLIGFKHVGEGHQQFQSFSPVENDYLPETFTVATEKEFEQAVSLATRAFPIYNKVGDQLRANFLDAIAEEIMKVGNILIERCAAETGLPPARLISERARTCGQLHFFAQLLREGWWVDARIDTAQNDRKPLRKPDIRRMLIPIGPVAVFGASNFPLAFSTAGGDTASALAAGCPVIVKSHSSHAGTNELVACAIVNAAQITGMPEGVFSSLYLSREHSVKLVQHPEIKAVGFTGSQTVGMSLFNAAVTRREPIPVYAEMSAINPVVLLNGALKTQKEKIAKELAASVTMGAGQFCTCPGLILLVESVDSHLFLSAFGEHMASVAPATLLNKNIHKAYGEGVQFLQNANEATLLSNSWQKDIQTCVAKPAAYLIDAADFLANERFSDEVFGPTALVVHCKDETELLTVLNALRGQLTATVHATEEDAIDLQDIIAIMTQKAGRVIYGGYPTGVEVCHAMQHGGPFPSTTDPRSTSVGSAAINRFLRPVAFQNFPDRLLPDALKRENPLSILRLVDGRWTLESA